MSHKYEYQKVGQDHDIKREITMRIVESVKANGVRFLKPYKEDGTIKYWFEVDTKEACGKAMDALRVKKEPKNIVYGTNIMPVERGGTGEGKPVNAESDRKQETLAYNKRDELHAILSSCAQLDDATFSALTHWHLPQLEVARNERSTGRTFQCTQEGVATVLGQLPTFQPPSHEGLQIQGTNRPLPGQQRHNHMHETADQIALLIPRIQESVKACEGMLKELEPQVSRFKIMLENLMAWQTWYHDHGDPQLIEG